MKPFAYGIFRFVVIILYGHYQASILHALGIPDKYIMERGGWKTDATLKNVYQHTIADKSKQFTDRANEHFSSIYATRNATHNKKDPLI